MTKTAAIETHSQSQQTDGTTRPRNAQPHQEKAVTDHHAKNVLRGETIETKNAMESEAITNEMTGVEEGMTGDMIEIGIGTEDVSGMAAEIGTIEESEEATGTDKGRRREEMTGSGTVMDVVRNKRLEAVLPMFPLNLPHASPQTMARP